MLDLRPLFIAANFHYVETNVTKRILQEFVLSQNNFLVVLCLCVCVNNSMTATVSP